MHDTIELHRLRGATILSLHRTAAPTPQRGKAFGADVVDDLDREGLLGHVLWSTDCRVTDVDPVTFAGLVRAGLFLVRLDLRSVRREHERAAVTAVQTLRRLDVLVEYEFDLLGGGSRFSDVHERTHFLRAIVCDGATPAYLDLPAAGSATYSPWLAAYLNRLDPTLDPWLCDQGLSVRLAEIWAELVITERLLRGVAGVAAHRIALQRLTMRSNTELLDLIAGSAHDFEQYGASDRLSADDVATRCARLDSALLELSNAFADEWQPLPS